ncbi:MAG: type I DNA topoisomerase [Lentisphaeria bacterium]|nr:type I DNA topoisomerase [Lentisphaeria bacterium]
MGTSLVIVESPAKARTIGRYLGREVNVLASMGHVRDLPESSLGVDVAGGFQPVYVLTANGKRVIRGLTAAARAADHIYLATDPDREGEAIAWHLAEVLKPAARSALFHRVAFHEITQRAIRASFDHPGVISEPLVAAQQARRVIDRLVGYQVSPLLWRNVRKGTSAGRVQSVALRLVCEREREVQAFTPEEYWNLDARFRTGMPEAEFGTRLVLLDDRKPVVPDAETANALAGELETAAFAVAAVTATPRLQRPQPPFITSTLQQAGGNSLKLSTTQTMRLAQQLYEGVDVGSGGPVGLITYMRTDSVHVAPEAQKETLEFIGQTYGAEYLPSSPNRYRSRQSAQEAHEAIRPTDVRRTPESLAPHLTAPQLRLYRLIWNRFVASQMAPARQMDHVIDVRARGESLRHSYVFRASSRETLFPGFLRVYDLRETGEEEADGQNRVLPEVPVGVPCNLVDLEREQCFTSPPPRYSEAMLIKALEQNGVGRPSTYSPTVNTIQEREYVTKEKGRLIPTELGFQVNDYLVGHMPELFDVGFTAEMEAQLDRVEEGERDWREMLHGFYEQFRTWVQHDGMPPIPSAAEAVAFLRAFPPDLTWNPPVRRGRRTFDDAEFHHSLLNQLESGGKPLTERQWKALLGVAARYAPSCPAIRAAAEALGVTETVARMAAETVQAREGAPPQDAAPAAEDLRLLDALRGVAWRPPATRGRRTYDDARFYRSLRRHVDSGNRLSAAQTRSLERLLTAYADQIPDFDRLAADLGLARPGERAAATAAANDNGTGANGPDPIVIRLLAMAERIQEWAPPTQRGKQTYDDRVFVESLKRQFHTRGTLSERQVAALKSLMGRYAERIEGFEQDAAALGLTRIETKPKPVDARVPCPKCGSPLVQRRNRRNGKPFYGCSAFPKCRYLSNELPQPGKDAAAPNHPATES